MLKVFLDYLIVTFYTLKLVMGNLLLVASIIVKVLRNLYYVWFMLI